MKKWVLLGPLPRVAAASSFANPPSLKLRRTGATEDRSQPYPGLPSSALPGLRTTAQSFRVLFSVIPFLTADPPSSDFGEASGRRWDEDGDRQDACPTFHDSCSHGAI
jgi:hypothetical protein